MMQQSQDIFEFIINTKIFLIASTSINLNDVNPEIRSQLISNKQYTVKSHVPEDIFQSFINHWTKKVTPCLTSENIFEYEKLSYEFDRMNDLIQLFHIKYLEYDKIKVKNSDFRDEIPKIIEKLDKANQKYQKIIYSLTSSSELFTTKNKFPIYESIKLNDASKISQLTREKIILNDLIFVLNEEDKTCCLFGSKHATGDIFVPYSVISHSNEYVVTKIFQGAFNYSEEIKSIQFPENSKLHSICQSAFSNSSIKHITIPSSVKKIGNFAFDNCDQIESVEIFENSELEIIGKSAFCNSSLPRIFIPSKVKQIMDKAFDGCEHLEEVQFAENSELQSIGACSFRETIIKNIVIPSHVKEIGENSFCYCTKLENMVFLKDSELEIIGEGAFCASSLVSLTIPSSVKEIKKYWLQETQNLNKITIIPNDEQNILYYKNEFILKKSDKTKDIYDILIFARRDIKKIEIPSFITKIEPNAFDKCEQAQSINFTDDSQLQIFGECDFAGCSFESITIPSSVVKIEDGCFANSPNLNQIKIMPNNQYFCCFENQYILTKSNFYKDEYDVLIFARKDIKFAYIPSFIKKIGPLAFASCNKLFQVIFTEDSKLEKISKYAFQGSSLVKIIIPRHLKIIGEYAFCFCGELKQVDFSEDSELEIIKQNAFLHDGSLSYIYIPPKVVRICNDAFYYCNLLEYIFFAKNSKLQFIGNSAFAETAIKNVTFPSSLQSIEELVFWSCKNLKKVEFSENSELKIIEGNAFCNSSLEEISIPSSIVEFNNSWCHKVAYLTKITIFPTETENITYFEDKFILGKSDLNNDFYDVLKFARRDIRKAIIPSFIKQIAPFAFHKCKNLQEVEFEDETKLIEIGEHAFSSTSINNFFMPPNVEEIKKSTFCKCKKLCKINIPPNSALKFIGSCSFWDSRISSIHIPFSVTKISKSSFQKHNYLQIIEFSDNYKIEPINEQDFFDANCLMLPAKFKKILEIKF